MRVSIRSSVEPSAMFSGEHLPPFYLSYLYSIYFPPVDLLLSVLRCSSSVPVISPAALYCLGHILLPVVWYIDGLARRSRFLKCCCVLSSATVVGVLPPV